MHTVFALLCFVVVIHWLIFPYPSGLLHWHCGNLTIAPVPAKQPGWIWINTSCEFIMNDCITTTKQSTTKPCAYFLGYTVAGYVPSTPTRHERYLETLQTDAIPANNLKIVLITFHISMFSATRAGQIGQHLPHDISMNENHRILFSFALKCVSKCVSLYIYIVYLMHL